MPPAIAARQDSFSFEKEVGAGVTMITMHGTLNETFDAKAVAASIRTNKLLISMADIRRFASWGMSEWMEFLRATAECDVYLVECSTYSVSQLNLVTGLLGPAKLVSFYASYRCGSCSEEMQTLFLIPRDRAMISEIPNSTQDCRTCGGRARLEEYPAAFFDAIAQRPAFDIDDEALAFMRTRLNYDLSPDLSRFRAFRRSSVDRTYLRLSGNVSNLPVELLARVINGATVIDLEHVVFEPTQMGSWHTFLKATGPNVRSIQLMNCPPQFLEVGVTPAELRDKVKVRSFAQAYICETCGIPTRQLVDVALNLEHLVVAAIPAAKCPSCRSTLASPVSEEFAAVLRALPARDRDVELENFTTKARAEPIEKLENCLVEARSTNARNGRLPLAIGAVVVLAAVGVAAWRSHGEKEIAKKPVEPEPTKQKTTAPPQPGFNRPDWITSDVPAAGYCADMTNRLVCVGVSSYRKSRDEGGAEANDVALEELVNTIGLKIADPYFRDTIVPTYAKARTQALSTLQGAGSASSANEGVLTSRKRTVEALRTTGGAAVPVQRSDWYWEEYAADGSNGKTEFLVFVRFDLSLDAVHALVDKYGASTTVGSANGTVMTAFPELAWQSASFVGGVVVTKSGPRFARAGIKPGDVVIAVGDQNIIDSTGLAKALGEARGDVKLTIKTNDSDKTVSLH